MYEKTVHRQQVPNFNPKSTIEIINNERSQDSELSEEEKRQLLQQYLDVSDIFIETQLNFKFNLIQKINAKITKFVKNSKKLSFLVQTADVEDRQ